MHKGFPSLTICKKSLLIQMKFKQKSKEDIFGNVQKIFGKQDQDGRTEYLYTQGDLTQIFPTFSNPIPVKQSAKQCRIMCKAQILPPGLHFVITLNYMSNFRSKNILYKTNIKNGQKLPYKIASLILHCIYMFFCKYFFLKLVQKCLKFF